jgi:hypothetical protein
VKITAGIALAITFIVLRLTEVITWSWWWVLSPLWIGAIVGLLLLGGAVALVAWTPGPRHPRTGVK